MNTILRSLDSRLVTLLLAAILIAGTLSIIRPDVFLSSLNINSMLLQSSVIGLLSVAVAVTMLTGGIDLSINATANLTSIIVALFLSALAQGQAAGAESYLLALLGVGLGLLVGTLCGLANGILVAVLGYSPILATLGTMTLFVGIGTVLTGGNTLFGISAFEAIGRGSILAIPFPAMIFLLAALVLSLVLEARRFGFYVYLFGANESAAIFSGIDARNLILKVYVISGLLSAIAGLLNLGITNSANVDFGSSYVLLAILISVLGGISPSGGSGRILGVVLAVFILQFLSTGLNLVFQSSGSNFLKDFAWGATLLVVLAIGGRRYFWTNRIVPLTQQWRRSDMTSNLITREDGP
jgi:simple sugar transport system permease protein